MPNTDYYRDVYKRRGEWWGATSKEQYVNIAKKYFEDYLLSSPTADTIIVDRVSTQSGIMENKQDDTLMSKYFLIGLDIPVIEGSFIHWYNDDWIVIRKEKKTFEAYNKVLALKCNYTLKWVDSLGVLNAQRCYLYGHTQSKIEESFNTWNGVYSPDPNKFLQVITPFVSIPLEQRFIIRDEAWKVTKKDLISVNGILYITMIEDRVDSNLDDLVNGVANNNNLNTSYIDLGITSLSLGTNESFTFSPVLYKNGQIITNVSFIYTNANNLIKITNSTVTAKTTLGNSAVLVSYDDLITNCPINIASSIVNTSFVQIVGDENIKHGRTRTYTVFYNDGSTIEELNSTFVLLNNSSNLITTMTNDSTSCTLVANSIGTTGDITLRASTAYGDFDKIISVVSIW